MANQPMESDNPLKGKKTGKWTKYGGAVYGLVKEAIQEKWYCQTCGSENPAELKPFLLELYPGDFIRVCNLCANLTNKKITIRRVIAITRHDR